MVSTVASGNVAPYVGPNDIAMMYSVVDVAGLNAISRKVIGNAAAAGLHHVLLKPHLEENLVTHIRQAMQEQAAR